MCRWTGASPRRRAAVSAPGAARWTGPSSDSSAPSSPTAAGCRSPRCPRRPTPATICLEVAQAAAEKGKKAAATAGTPDALSDAHSAYAHAQSIKVPPEPRLLADDATPEAIVSLLANHGGRIAVVSAEGGLLDTLAGGRYSKTPNIEPLLKGHAGDRI